MALQLINTGTAANDGTGDTLRTAGQKMNDNASELYGLVADTQGALGEKLEADALAPFETSNQLNARDTANRDRGNHTGSQAAATIIDFASAAAAAAPVQSVAGKTGLVSLVKADVELGEVNNTADAFKPISTATQAALNAKAGIQATVATLTYAATTNLDMAVLTGTYQTISLTGNLTLTTSNLLAGRTVSVRLLADATARTLTFPAGWRFLGAGKPINIAANKAALLAIVFFGAADTDGLCAYSVEP